MSAIYSPTHKTLSYTKYNKDAETNEERFTHYDETLYCGRVLHPFVMTLRALKTGRVDIQEAFTSLLLQSQEFKIHPYQLQTIIDEMFGEGSAQQVLDKYSGSTESVIRGSSKEFDEVITHGDIGLGFAVSKSD